MELFIEEQSEKVQCVIGTIPIYSFYFGGFPKVEDEHLESRFSILSIGDVRRTFTKITASFVSFLRLNSCNFILIFLTYETGDSFRTQEFLGMKLKERRGGRCRLYLESFYPSRTVSTNSGLTQRF